MPEDSEEKTDLQNLVIFVLAYVKEPEIKRNLDKLSQNIASLHKAKRNKELLNMKLKENSNS